MSVMSIISVRNLSKNFRVSKKEPGLIGTFNHFFSRNTRTIRAVDDISFDIQHGEIVGFIGPNGAGKTTTLKMLCGLIHPSKGLVNVASYIPYQRTSSFLKQITLVMGQKQQLIWDLPPMDSLRVNASVYGLSDTEAKNRIKELSEMLDLGEELYRPVRKLSLGERMKAELMASLLHRPSILFLDEPTLGLDFNAQVRVREFLKSYNKKFQATVLLTSHYMGDINFLCDRTIIIDKGKLFFDGSLKELTSKLSPFRSVRLELTKPYTSEYFSQYGELVEFNPYYVELLIPKTSLTERLSLLLDNLPIKDLEITDPPIENLIAKMFTSNKDVL